MATSPNTDKVNLNFCSFDATFTKKRTYVKIETIQMAGTTKQADGAGGRNKPNDKQNQAKNIQRIEIDFVHHSRLIQICSSQPTLRITVF